jgi:asparagine synthetase B (glutamine-hydrolysing)
LPDSARIPPAPARSSPPADLPDAREPGFRFLAPAGRPTVASARATQAAALAGLPLRFDRDAALALLAYGVYGFDRSFFHGVSAVAPRATVSPTSEGVLAAIDPPAPPAREVGEAEAAAGLRAALDAAVQDAVARCRRPAVGLSGGLDSSAVAISADRAMKRLGRPADELILYHHLPIAGPNERVQATAVASALGRPLFTIQAVERDPFEGAERVAAEADFPYDAPGSAPDLAMRARLKSEGVDACLTGDGGDEIFGAYRMDLADPTPGADDDPRPAPIRWLRRLAKPAWRALAPWWLEERRLGRPWWLAKRHRGAPPPESHPPARPGLVGAAADRDRAARSSRQSVIVSWYRALDRATAVRSEFPVLDPRVLDFLVSIPQALTGAGGRDKGLLRLAYAQDMAPISRDRTKDQPPVEPRRRAEIRRYGAGWADRFWRDGILERLDLLPTSEAFAVMARAAEGTVDEIYRALALVWIAMWARAHAL